MRFHVAGSVRARCRTFDAVNPTGTRRPSSAERARASSVVDVSLMSVGAWAIALSLGNAMLTNEVITPASLSAPMNLAVNPVIGTYRTSDGRWINFNMLQGFLGMYRDAVKAAGKAPGPIVVRANVMMGDSPGGADRMAMSGSLDQIKDDVRRVAELGVDQMFFDFYLTLPPPEVQLRTVDELMKAAG